jgi:undecaprenyl pyrophosphate phosphatase UppP
MAGSMIRLISVLVDEHGRGKHTMKAKNRNPFLALLLQISTLVSCIIMGMLFSELMEETWVIPVWIAAGLIILSAIGVIAETRKPRTNQNRIGTYPKILPIFCC